MGLFVKLQVRGHYRTVKNTFGPTLAPMNCKPIIMPAVLLAISQVDENKKDTENQAVAERPLESTCLVFTHATLRP